MPASQAAMCAVTESTNHVVMLTMGAHRPPAVGYDEQISAMETATNMLQHAACQCLSPSAQMCRLEVRSSRVIRH